MKYEAEYLTQTDALIKYYHGKQSRIKDYIVTCNNYITELRSLDPIEIFTDLEYERSFIQLLDLVQETFRPNHFISCASDAFIRIFEDDFITYMLTVKGQLKRPVTWRQLNQLDFNFSMIKMKYEINTGFREDFLPFAINKIKLSELWTFTIN